MHPAAQRDPSLTGRGGALLSSRGAAPPIPLGPYPPEHADPTGSNRWHAPGTLTCSSSGLRSPPSCGTGLPKYQEVHLAPTGSALSWRCQPPGPSNGALSVHSPLHPRDPVEVALSTASWGDFWASHPRSSLSPHSLAGSATADTRTSTGPDTFPASRARPLL